MSKNTSNHSNQCNPNNGNYQGYSSSYQGSGTRSDLNNHSNQMNSNNGAYYSSRGGNSGRRWDWGEWWSIKLYLKEISFFFRFLSLCKSESETFIRFYCKKNYFLLLRGLMAPFAFSVILYKVMISNCGDSKSSINCIVVQCIICLRIYYWVKKSLIIWW